MNANAVYAIVLAAGKGTRMRSDQPKVLHPVCGKPMLEHIMDTLRKAVTDDIVAVVGHRADKVREKLGERCRYAVQKQQRGTAHAVMMCRSLLADREGTTLIVTGDTPLVKVETLQRLLGYHRVTEAAATMLTMRVDDPTGYGRVIRDDAGRVERVVEEKDASAEEKAVREVNAGIFCFDNTRLFSALREVNNDNAQQEYYLPDVIEVLKTREEKIAAFVTGDPDECLGVNDRIQLAEAERIMRRRILKRHMKNGVTVLDPLSTYIDADVVIGKDTVIEPETHLRGNTVVGQRCWIGPGADLIDCRVEDGARIRNSVLYESHICRNAAVGPFVTLCSGSVVEEAAQIRDFTASQPTRIEKGEKAVSLL